jgi:predicted transcriptional regulator
MISAGPIGVRKLACKVECDVSNVCADTEALNKAGVIDRTETRVKLPYDALHVA